MSEEIEGVFMRLRSALGLTSDKALAERLGMGYSAFAARKARESLPRAEIDELCEAARLNLDWVYTGKGEPRPGAASMLAVLGKVQSTVAALALEGDEARQVAEFLQYANTGDRERLLPLVRKLGFVTVPRFDIQAAAGDGVVVSNHEEVVDSLAFRADWLREIGVRPKDAAVIKVRGDSMNDTLSDGDLVVIDTQMQAEKMSGIYVLSREDMLLIKRLNFKMNGSVEIRSDNKAYPTETLSAAEFDRVRVVGRMVRRLVR